MSRKPQAEYMRQWARNNPAKKLLISARTRAKAKGLAFNISEQDVVIPAFCPVLGIPIVIGGPRGPNSPSLDRIDSTQGYVRGNTAVISWKANNVKNSGTADEHRAIAEWMTLNTRKS